MKGTSIILDKKNIEMAYMTGIAIFENVDPKAQIT